MDWEYLENLIKPLKDKNGKFNSQKIKDNINIINELNQIDFLQEFNTNIEKLFAIKNHLIERPKCICGNTTNYVKNLKQYKQYCSRSCPEMKKILQEKRVKSNLEKYGVENTSSLESTRKKVKQTNIKKYGCENPNQNKEVLNKRKTTNLEKYGFEVALQNKEIREKAKQTNIKKYGSEYYFSSKNGKEKIKNNFRNYVINNTLPKKLEFIKDQYNIIPHGWDLNNYTGIKSIYQFQHLDCGKIFETHLEDGLIPKCSKCHFLHGYSKIELKLREELINIFGKDKIDYNNRQYIKPYELDIVINDKVVIEVNGTYWHREENKNISLLEKSNLCPIPLLHFWDYELENKFDICMSMILSKLGKYKEKIGARKCDYKKINSKEAKEFFENNHLQGSSNASTYYGLYYEDELIQCISIGKSRFNKNYDYEIHRLATKMGLQVIGGVSRLFSKIRQDLGGSILITYADKRYSHGDIYKKLGFQELKDSLPNYTWRNNKEIYPRYKTQKHKLSKLLREFNSELSESENMQLSGFHKFSDCGNKVFKMEL